MPYKLQRVYNVEKSLSDRLAKRDLTKNKSKVTKNKVAFLALRNDINEAIHAGWAIKTIWEILSEEGKISFSYKTFRTYVSRLILAEKSTQPSSSSSNSNKNKTITAIPTFTFQSK